ncbi:unnamed protein product [marine sediment metagenome]|uniref:Uncharacterized protein n=1 Tax=marine sediment metagenome TaxID=412755 RepID=X1KZC8_9ZZZZ
MSDTDERPPADEALDYIEEIMEENNLRPTQRIETLLQAIEADQDEDDEDDQDED